MLSNYQVSNGGIFQRGHTSKELRMYKISLVKVFNKLVSNDAFIENVKKFTTKPTSLENLDIAVKQVFEALIDITLNLPTKKNAFVKSNILPFWVNVSWMRRFNRGYL